MQVPLPLQFCPPHCAHLERVITLNRAADVIEEMTIKVLLVTTTATLMEANDFVDEERRSEGKDDEGGTRMRELADI